MTYSKLVPKIHMLGQHYQILIDDVLLNTNVPHSNQILCQKSNFSGAVTYVVTYVEGGVTAGWSAKIHFFVILVQKMDACALSFLLTLALKFPLVSILLDFTVDW